MAKDLKNWQKLHNESLKSPKFTKYHPKHSKKNVKRLKNRPKSAKKSQIIEIAQICQKNPQNSTCKIEENGNLTEYQAFSTV